MIHYSCDRCRRLIELDEDLRYSVDIEIRVTIDSTEFETEEERDHLGELHEVMERMDDDERAEVSQYAYQKRRFDLCSQCHREYVKNPLAIESTSKVGFSEN